MSPLLSVKQLAERVNVEGGMQITEARIRRMIEAGQLSALDLNPTGKNRKWAIPWNSWLTITDTTTEEPKAARRKSAVKPARKWVK